MQNHGSGSRNRKFCAEDGGQVPTKIASEAINESLSRCNRAKVEVIGLPANYLIQTFHHVAGVQPFHVPACLDTHHFEGTESYIVYPACERRSAMRTRSWVGHLSGWF